MFRKFKKNGRKTKKNKGMTLAISSLVRIWKISHSYPGCSLVWKIRVVYFLVKHLYHVINNNNTTSWLQYLHSTVVLVVEIYPRRLYQSR